MAVRDTVDAGALPGGYVPLWIRARDAASRFMTAMAGDRPGYEEASRALFAGDRARLAGLVRAWPRDVRTHLERLLQAGDAKETEPSRVTA